MLTRILLTWLINAVAVYATATFVPDITVENIWSALLAALVLGLVNTFVRPILMLLSLPLIVATLGLFLLVINALMLLLASALLPGFEVKGFFTAIFGAALISLVSFILGLVLKVEG
ncbi:MAG: phage holin family protein [Candidatus Thermochlorobacter aerophilum]|jgi:putative membrane protein|uniref:Phage holin family protein n=1 Tax=Candidatus Thermochlorobacter aerophilus TaxID=1868324 RepID=A0A395M202_9BACT|nr:MAG: phage holin family protein [Candidatus Thermochlorobacter aerophilum]